MVVCDSNEYYYDYVDELLDELELSDIRARDIVTMHDEYKKPGYALNVPEQLGKLAGCIGYWSLEGSLPSFKNISFQI